MIASSLFSRFRIVCLVAGISCLFPYAVNSESYYRIGQVSDIDLAKRQIVIDGQRFRLSSTLQFTSERSNVDLLTGLGPGTFVKYNASSAGQATPITELHAFENPPM